MNRQVNLCSITHSSNLIFCLDLQHDETNKYLFMCFPLNNLKAIKISKKKKKKKKNGGNSTISSQQL